MKKSKLFDDEISKSVFKDFITRGGSDVSLQNYIITRINYSHHTKNAPKDTLWCKILRTTNKWWGVPANF